LAHNNFTVVAACADLMFSARVKAAADAAGYRVVLLSARAEVVDRVRQERPALILIDLDARWLDAPALIAALKDHGETSAIPVVAVGSHVRTEVMAAARAAGADRVLARSAFVRQLPDLMRAVAG
jgi:CheY-like chemotaxis protein